MKILFYQPYNQAVPYIESVAECFANEGHTIYFLSHAARGETHRNLEQFGCKTFSHELNRSSFFQYYKTRISNLAKFCTENKIHIVYSHFQEANLISVIAQYFCKAAFVINRHHSDCAFIDDNWKERWGDKIINRLAKVYISTSPKVHHQIIDIEKKKPDKVKLINYGYNFDRLPKPDPQKVVEIRKAYPAKILLVKAARYIPEKRHRQLIDAISVIVKSGVNTKLLLLGKGPLEETIYKQIKSLELTARVFQLGFQTNIMDYYGAADLVVHFSITEASNSAIKEAAITDTPVAVCKDVGDFSDYIVSGQNGFLLNKDNPAIEFVALLEGINAQEYNLSKMGKQLHTDVVKRYDIKNVVHDYRQLNQSIGNGIAE